MKRISLGIMGTGLFLVTSLSMAVPTPLDAHWTCKTNASSSSVASEVAADKDMSETPRSASSAYLLAAKNCRDCTKITCEVSN